MRQVAPEGDAGRSRTSTGPTGRFLPSARGKSTPRSALHGGDGEGGRARRGGGDSRRWGGRHLGDPRGDRAGLSDPRHREGEDRGRLALHHAERRVGAGGHRGRCRSRRAGRDAPSATVENRCARWSPRFMPRAALRWPTLARSTTRATRSTAASTLWERHSVVTRLTARAWRIPTSRCWSGWRGVPGTRLCRGTHLDAGPGATGARFGASFVVVGTATTNPAAITARFVSAIAPE